MSFFKMKMSFFFENVFYVFTYPNRKKNYAFIFFLIYLFNWKLITLKYCSVFCKEIQPVHSKGDQSWVFIGRTDTEAESPIL